MSVAQTTILESLFAPCPTTRFLNDYWPDKPLSTHGNPARLPAYLRSEVLSSFAKLAARYHGRVSFGNATAANGTAVAADVPTALLRRMGLSLYLPDLDACVPGTAEFLRALERELEATPGVARIGAFAAAEHNGVTTHYDAEEVISVQLEGEKRFFIAPMNEISYPYGMQFGPGYEAYDDLYPQMDGGIPRVDDGDLECIEMRPGSVLFMPRGTWHRTEAAEESLSVSIIVRQPAAVEAVSAHLRLALLRDAKWRRPLYGIEGNGGVARARVGSLLADLALVAADQDPGAVLDTSRSAPARLARLDERSWLQRIPNARLLLSPHPLCRDLWCAVVRVDRFDGGEHNMVKLDVPPELQPLLQWLDAAERPLRGVALTTRFPDIPWTQMKALLDVLVRAGYLKLLRHVPLRLDDGDA